MSAGQETLERLVVIAVARVSDGANISLGLAVAVDLWRTGDGFLVDERGPSSSEDIIDLHGAEIESDQMNGATGGRGPPMGGRVTSQNIV